MTSHLERVGRGSLTFAAKLKLALSHETFLSALCAAVPSALVAFVVQYINLSTEGRFLDVVLPEKDLYSILSTIVGFLLVFHTSQAYNRYMSGITLVLQMMADFIDVMSLLVAFARNSAAPQEDVEAFVATAASLVSLLFISSLAELEDCHNSGDETEGELEVKGKLAYKYEMVDVRGLNEEALRSIVTSPCKVETICHMLHTLIGDNVRRGTLDTPPPLMTRVYQELGNGVLKFHEALKFRHAPFPVTYTAVTMALMVLHWCFTPFMVAAWTRGVASCSFATFVVIFVFWSLNGIASTLDNPFGNDIADMDGDAIAHEFNMKLTTFLRVHPHPGATKSREKISLGPSRSIEFDTVLQMFQDKGVIEYSREDLGQTSAFDVLAKVRNTRKKHRSKMVLGRNQKNKPQSRSGRPPEMIPHHQTSSLSQDMQQDVPPEIGGMVSDRSCSHDEPLGLQTDIHREAERGKDISDSALDNPLQQACDEAVQGVDHTMDPDVGIMSGPFRL